MRLDMNFDLAGGTGFKNNIFSSFEPSYKLKRPIIYNKIFVLINCFIFSIKEI